MDKEKRFYNALEDIFVGAKVEGDSGYINLLKIKEKYYSKVLDLFKEHINNDDIIKGNFKEEFFDNLYTFFNRYFSESGSVYFTKTANWQRVYEKVYTDNKDVVLFWKTHMLYYVKTDILFNSLDINIYDHENDDNYHFFFDVGSLESKQNNEKRKIIYEFDKVEESETGKVYRFNVMYSTYGRITKIDEIVRATKIPNNILDKAFRNFEKQSEVDFFINKNAKAFLSEQLDLYLHQILLEDENVFEQKRLEQIKTIKKYALDLIDFISQFEDELVRVWNKPKFVLDSNYVISLKTLKQLISPHEYKKLIKIIIDKINNYDEFKSDIIETIREIYKQPLQKIYVDKVEINNEIKISYVKIFKSEKDLKNYIHSNPNEIQVDKKLYDRENMLEGSMATYSGGSLIRNIPLESIFIDTKYFSEEFKNLLLDKISRKHDIDRVLDGYLVNSDNYQFLNTANKFNKKVSLVYIDPPFNTEGSSYAYLDKFKDSTWLTMLNDRLELTKEKFLSHKGNLYIHLDHHCNYLGRILTDNLLGYELNREIIWNTSPAISGLKSAAQNFIRQHDMILFYAKNESQFNKMYVNYQRIDVPELGWLDIFKDEDDKPYVYKYKENEDELSKFYIEDIPTMAVGDVWNDVYSMMYTQNMTRENWGVDNTQKPENLLRRIIQASTQQKEFVMDFYVGTGTTIASAHKLNRKWIGIESGEFIWDIVLKRMKSIVMGDIRPKLSIDINWQGGGFFKYYSLEQYEDTLRNMSYRTDQVDIFNDKKPFEDYIFYSDNKFADVLEIEGDNIELNFDKLYKNIDWPETISNLLGLPIKKIYQDRFILDENGVDKEIKIDFKNMDPDEKLDFVKLVRPLLWWGE